MMSDEQKLILSYMRTMRVGAMYLNTPTQKQWVFPQDIRESQELAEACRDAMLCGPWRFRLTEPINGSDKLGWYR